MAKGCSEPRPKNGWGALLENGTLDNRNGDEPDEDRDTLRWFALTDVGTWVCTCLVGQILPAAVLVCACNVLQDRGGPEQDTNTRLTDLTGVTGITKDGNYLNRKLMWL